MNRIARAVCAGRGGLAIEKELGSKRYLAGGAALAAVLAIVVLSPSAIAGTQNKCPSGGTPASGSRVSGGLEVDGVCILKNVTVNGGITVDSTGHLSQQGGTASGGINVNPNGELDVNALTLGSGAPTGTTSTINGGIRFNAGMASLSDADIWAARISGGIFFTGSLPLQGLTFSFPTFCSNTINGTVTFSNVTTYAAVYFGDPGPGGGPYGCPGNSINGSLQLINTHSTATHDEFENNIINGSVVLDNSQVELNGNTIGGSVQCKNGSVIYPGDPPDGPSNTCS
jgi:hypothetical protein